MERTISIDFLESKKACAIALEMFRTKFGERALASKVLKELHTGHTKKYPEWEGWLLGQNIVLTKYLLSLGANINVCDDYALCIASKRGDIALVRFIIEKGVNINTHCGYPLFISQRYKYRELEKLIREHM